MTVGAVFAIVAVSQNSSVGVEFRNVKTEIEGNTGRALLEIYNPNDFEIEVLGISRIDCGIKAVCGEAPFRIRPGAEHQVLCEMKFANSSGKFEIPVVLLVNEKPHQIPFQLKFESNEFSGVPTLAPPFSSVE